MRKADIFAVSNIEFASKGLPQHFESADDSSESKFWLNFIEVITGNSNKKDHKNGFDRTSSYRIKLLKPYNYQLDRVDFNTWLNRPKKD